MSSILTAFYLKFARQFVPSLDGKGGLPLLAISVLAFGALGLPALAQEAAPQQLPPLDLSSLGITRPMPNDGEAAMSAVGAPNSAEASTPAVSTSNSASNRSDRGDRKPESIPAGDGKYESGVKAYRDGDYAQAAKVFEALHRQAPENTRFTYYLAIAEAQLGRFQQAKKHYNEVVILDPNGEIAMLAKEGLKYLPPETSLDLPPRFSQQANGFAQGLSPGQAPNAGRAGNGQAAASGTANAQPAISPQDLMAWQMLMGQNNGNNSGGFNPMGAFMPGMMTGMPNSGSGSPTIDPNMMSTMLMNQMMQNMNLGGDPGENNR